jgi:serine/threonine-protein kinase SRPK3
MFEIEDTGILDDFEEAEKSTPSATNIFDRKRTTYATRKFRPPKNHAYGNLVLCDLGEARVGGPHEYEEILPEVYKAPEILIQFEWGHSVDIWNLACVVSGT